MIDHSYQSSLNSTHFLSSAILKELALVEFGLTEKKNCIDLQSENEIILKLNKSVLLGGKRLRPLLIYLVADFLEVPLKPMQILAKACERVHAASLSHDDVIDSAQTRRGIPCLHVLTDNKKAILAGDFLLADVIYELSQNEAFELLKSLSQVIKDLSLGEWMQMDILNNQDIQFVDIENVALKKTASLLSWCAMAPAVWAKKSSEMLDALKKFGMHLGLAFQFIDDVLDFEKSGSTLKKALIDLDNRVLNSVCVQYLKDNMHLLGQEKISGPWIESLSKAQFEELFSHQNLLDEAIYKIRSLGKKHLDQSRQLLKTIWDFSLTTGDYTQKSQSLEFLLNALENRQS